MRLRFLLAPLVLVAVLLLAAGCGGGSKKASVPNDAVAVVGDSTISKAQFDDLMASAKRSYSAKKQTFPKVGTTAYKSIQDQAVTYLVQESEFEQKGKTLGVVVTDQDVQKQLTALKKQYFSGSEKEYQKQLKAQGLTDAQVREQVKGQILSQRLYAKVTKGVTVTDAAIAQYYAAHISSYKTPATRHVRHILVNNKKLADQLESQLKGGADFAKLAKKYSKDTTSAVKGGDLGSISQGSTVAPFDKVAFSAKTNSISAPVHSQFGWHIIQPLGAITPAKQTPLKSVKASIKSSLLTTKKQTVMNNWVKQVEADFDKRTTYAVGYTPAATTTSATTATTTG